MEKKGTKSTNKGQKREIQTCIDEKNHLSPPHHRNPSKRI